MSPTSLDEMNRTIARLHRAELELDRIASAAKQMGFDQLANDLCAVGMLVKDAKDDCACVRDHNTLVK